MHRCPNRACPSRGLETLINWVMAAADIEGVGEQSSGGSGTSGLVRSLPDLYRLTKEQLLELDGFGEISRDERDRGDRARRRQMPFCRVLFGLNIPDVGWVTAQNLARHFGTVDALLDGDAGGGRRRSKGSGPTAPRRSSSGSRTRRTASSSRSCASSACASRRARTSGRSRGR